MDFDPTVFGDDEESDLEATVRARTIASADYPMLSEILVDRPPLEHSRKVASRSVVPVTIEQKNAGLFGDIMNGLIDPPVNDPNVMYNSQSFDWCRFRRNSRCYYPKTVDASATRQAGYPVWNVEDRGHCRRDHWDEQETCPVGEPGPNSKHPDAQIEVTKSWRDGGQRNGRMAPMMAISLRSTADVDDVNGVVGSFKEFTIHRENYNMFSARVTSTGKPAGWLNVIEYKDQIGNVRVSEEYRRQGLATALLEVARRFYPDLKHESDPGQLSNDGRAWSQAVGSKTAGYKGTAFRGIPVSLESLGFPEAREIIEALAQGNMSPMINEIFSQIENGKREYWHSGQSSSAPGGTGMFWSSDKSNADLYASTREKFAVSVVLTAEYDQDSWAHGHEMDGRGTNWWKLDAGTPLSVTKVVAEIPTREQAQGMLDEADSQGQWASTDEFKNWGWDQQIDLPVSRMPRTAGSRSAGKTEFSDQQIPLSVTASFEYTAAWSDVQTKAAGIRRDGGVKIIASTDHTITAEIQGTTAVYQTTLMRQPGTKRTALWECGCAWAAYSWGRSGRWKRFEGRMCSHALALTYEAQSQEWGGGSLKSGPGHEERPTFYEAPQPGKWRKGSKDLSTSALSRRDFEIEESGDSADQNRTLTFSRDGEEVGYVTVYGPYYNRAKGKVKNIEVYSDHRRQGIATLMFEVAEGWWMDLDVIHSDDRTSDGDAWVRSLGSLISATASSSMTLYHGTRAEYVPQIKSEGLKPPSSVNPWTWYMLTTSKEQAARYSPFEDSVVLEFEVPLDGGSAQGQENSYLGLGRPHNVYGYSATAYGVAKGPLPTEYLVAEHSARSIVASKTANVEDDFDGPLIAAEEAAADGEFTHSGLIVKAADSGRVLLTQRTPYADDPEDVYGRWEFPGGGIDDGETALDSAMREFNEESGLDLPEEWVVKGHYSNGPYFALIVLVSNEAWTTEAELLSHETMGIGWFDIDALTGSDLARGEMDETDWDLVKESSKIAGSNDVGSDAWIEAMTKSYLTDPISDSKSVGSLSLKSTPADSEECRMIYALSEGSVVGTLFFGLTGNGESMGAVDVAPTHRRKGVASAMYEWAEELSGTRMVPDTPHSNDASGFWNQNNRAFGAISRILSSPGLRTIATSSGLAPSPESIVAEAGLSEDMKIDADGNVFLNGREVREHPNYHPSMGLTGSLRAEAESVFKPLADGEIYVMSSLGGSRLRHASRDGKRAFCGTTVNSPSKQPASVSEAKSLVTCSRCLKSISKTSSSNTESMLNDEPEEALPSTNGADEAPAEAFADDAGSVSSPEEVADTISKAREADEDLLSESSMAQRMASLGGPDEEVAVVDEGLDVAAAAKDFLSDKTAAKTFTALEQQQIIDEGDGTTTASNLDRLQIEGTSYELLEAQRKSSTDTSNLEDLFF